MEVYESWGVTDLIEWVEDTTSAEWYKSLYAYHPNWSQWPHHFWTQGWKYDQWSWYATNREV